MGHGEASEAPRLSVSVVFCPGPGAVDESLLSLPSGATAADAVRASGLAQRHSAAMLAGLTLGIWGARCEPTALLRDRDRVELYRPLVADPKESRRRRQRAATPVRARSRSASSDA
jgi:putative ubiquitin-RnfH superfamily antitoxin RatB of RatAB toxin-antitoxin module